MYTFGSRETGLQYVELPVVVATVTIAGAPVELRLAPRPPEIGDSGAVVLLVRDPATLDALDPAPVDGSGFWTYTSETLPVIEVSTDGTNWIPVIAREALLAAVTASVDVQTAVDSAAQAATLAAAANATAAAANTKADAALAAVAGGGGGGAGGFTWANAAAGAVGVVIKAGSSWPVRPTDRTDVSFLFLGAAPFPPAVTSGTGGYYEGVDVILEKPA